MKAYDVVIVGGGPAGLAAAVSAKEEGTDSILILERDKELGGILNQCIHNGFGLHTFKEELTGPEYAGRFIEKVKELEIEYKLNTMVINIGTLEDEEISIDIPDNKELRIDAFEDSVNIKENTKAMGSLGNKIVTAMNREEGLFEIQAKAIILAMGCRERPRGALNIPGYRPAGIFSAGTAQRLVNMEGYLPGREVVILGSGDIGLIMARRMTLEGAKVKVVAELLPYSGGLKRNIVQCLDDYDIPLKLSHTIVDIKGQERIEGITLAEVDEKGIPIPETEEYISCDTLLLSCGLIPENELSKGLGIDMEAVTGGPVVNESLETSMEGVFACGNVLHVHDLVDFVSEEAAKAGKYAVRYIKKDTDKETQRIDILPAAGVRYTVPKYLRPANMEDTLTVRFRVDGVYKNCYICTYFDKERMMRRKRPVVAPGEMEEVKLSKDRLAKYPNLKTITIKLEEA